MAGAIRDTGPKQPRVQDAGPAAPRVPPEAVAAALGAQALGPGAGGAPPTLSARLLAPELARRLRSIGGRPGLEGASRPMRIPVRLEDAEKLSRVARKLEGEGVRATPGQVASMLLHTAVSQMTELSTVEIEPILLPLAHWTDRPYIAREHRPRLRRAGILLVPRESFRGIQGPVFPPDTSELFQDLREHARKGLGVEICSPEEDYREFALYSALLILGTFVVTSVAAPVLVNLLTDYLRRRVGAQVAATEVEAEFLLRDEKGFAFARARYKGPAEGFQSKMLDALSQMKPRMLGPRQASSKPRPKRAGGR